MCAAVTITNIDYVDDVTDKFCTKGICLKVGEIKGTLFIIFMTKVPKTQKHEK